MNVRMVKGALYFVVGFLLVLAGTAGWMSRGDAPLEGPPLSLSASHKLVAWRLEGLPLPGERVVVRAQHQEAGTAGQFRFVVFQRDGRSQKLPRFVKASEPMTASQPGQWSSWSFSSRFSSLLVGVAWAGPQPPIRLQKEAWRPFGGLFSYGVVGGKVDGKWTATRERYGLRGGLEAYIPRAFPAFAISSLSWSLGLLVVLLGILLWHRRWPGPWEWTWGLAGATLAFRLWATLDPNYWNWGGHFLAFLSRPISTGLLLALPLGCVLGASLPRRWLSWRLPGGSRVLWGLAVGALALAWLVRSSRLYGDGFFGFVGMTHGPLLFALFQPLVELGAWVGLKRNLVAQGMTSLLLLPFLLLLYRILKAEAGPRRVTWLLMFFFLSVSTLQDFCGYQEVYGIPMLCTLALVYCAYQTLEGKAGLFLPTMVAFVGYALHIAEGLMILPLGYVWVHQLVSRRVRLRQAVFSGLAALGVGTLLLMISGFAIYTLKYQGDLAAFTHRFPYYGLEFLWGGVKERGVSSFLGWSEPIEHPNGMYLLPSVENLLKGLNFVFHYSSMACLLPLLLLLVGRWRALRDGKTAFLCAGYLTYLAFMLVLRPGFYHPVYDWDLLSPLPVLGALLLERLLRPGERLRIFFTVAWVNLLHTIPWILLNHGSVRLPW